jgi:hypothetical protein
MLLRAVVLAVLLASCGDTTLKKQGQRCVSSSECEPGLLCDDTRHQCLGKGLVDAAVMVDAATD